MNLKLLLLLGILLGPVCIGYGQDTSTHYQKAIRFLEVMREPQNLQANINSMLDNQIRIHPEIARFKTQMLAFFNKYMNWDSLKEDMGTLYMKEFTSAELDRLIRFFQTDLGQKWVSSQPGLFSEGMKIGQDHVQPYIPELDSALQKESASDTSNSGN